MLILAVAMTGCVKSPPVSSGKRYLWPASATDARIEYIDFFSSDADLHRGEQSWFEEIVLGKEPAAPLFRTPVAIDARFGKVAVTDTTLRVAYLMDLSEKRLEVIGGGSETSIPLTSPMDVALIPDRKLLVVDSVTKEVRRFSFSGEFLGGFGKEFLSRPTAIAVNPHDGRVFVVDTGAHRLAVFSSTGEFINYLGERGGGAGQFNFPVDAGFGSDGKLFVLDALNARVQRFVPDGPAYRYDGEFGERGTSAGSFSMPKALAVSASGHIYVTDALQHKVVVFDQNGTFLLNFGGRYTSPGGQVAPGGLYMPRGIASSENDEIWVADMFNRMIHRFQYLNEEYLRSHPISKDQVLTPFLLEGADGR